MREWLCRLLGIEDLQAEVDQLRRRAWLHEQWLRNMDAVVWKLDQRARENATHIDPIDHQIDDHKARAALIRERVMAAKRRFPAEEEDWHELLARSR